MQKLLFLVALALGFLIAWMDSRPHWDDTGITVGAILLTSGLSGFVGPRRPWLWALAIGLWIPAYTLLEGSNYGGLVAVVFAFAGAYAGMALRRTVAPLEREG